MNLLRSRQIELIFDGTNTKAADVYDLYKLILSKNDLPVILSGEHFSKLIGVDKKYIFSASNDAQSFYRIFKIRKSSGGMRDIAEPLPLLKLIQKWILSEILEKLATSPFVKSYKKGLSLKDNARFHINSFTVLKYDLRNFFDNIKISQVYDIFYSAGYTKLVSLLLSKLCTLQGSIAQGSPTSGAISNIALKDFDKDLFYFLNNRGIRYSRYADDITLSSKTKILGPDRLLIEAFLVESASKVGQRLNLKKSRILHRHNRHIVTGLVVNRKIAIPREDRMKFRQELYFIRTYGILGHAQRLDQTVNGCLQRLIGQAAYHRFVRADDYFAQEAHGFLVGLARQEAAEFSDPGEA